MSTAVIHIRNEVWCTFEGLKKAHIDILWDKFGPYKEGFRHMLPYKLGRWDGRIRFFEKTGKTYTKLLPQIIPIVENEFGYSLDLIDDRLFFEFPDLVSVTPFPNTDISLRPYQQQSVNLAINNGSGFILAGTGAGKTVMTGALSNQYANFGYETITIVPSADLVDQTFEFYEYCGLDVGQYSGNNKDIHHSNVVATWQAIQYNPKILQNFKCVIWDECHGIRGDVAQKLLNQDGIHIPFKFGVTGTFPKPEVDKLCLSSAVGDILIEIPARWLMDNGYLTEVEIQQICIKLKDKQDFPDYASERTFLSKNEQRMEIIAGLIIDANEKYGNTLVLVNSVSFGENLAKMIEGSVFLYGASAKEDRKEQYDQYENRNDIITIATTGIASTGISIDRIHCLIMVDAGKSFIKTIQSIGRSTRLAADKSKAHIIDIFSDLKWSKKHSRDREKWYAECEYPLVAKDSVKI